MPLLNHGPSREDKFPSAFSIMADHLRSPDSNKFDKLDPLSNSSIIETVHSLKLRHLLRAEAELCDEDEALRPSNV